MQGKGSFFYFGTLLSSTGSLVFSGALIPFLSHAGINLSTIGLILGGARLFGAILAYFLGPILENFSAKKLVIGTEVFAGAASLGILWIVSEPIFYVSLFCICYLFRSAVVGIQSPLKAKLTKTLAGQDEARANKHSSMLNNVTQGATFFAGLATWFFIEKVEFSWFVLFDAATFAIAGILLWPLDIPKPVALSAIKAPPNLTRHLVAGCTNFYRSCKKWAILDVALAIVLSGTTMLFARLSARDINMIPAFFAMYGLAVWVAGPVSRIPLVRRYEKLHWLLLGLSFLLLARFSNQGLTTLIVSFAKDLVYWTILHRISAKILHLVPLDFSNSVHAFRNFQMIGILSLGEYWVGTLSQRLSLFEECAWRAGLCMIVFAMLTLKSGGQSHD